MKEILDFELCKRLYEAGLRVETEKGYPEDGEGEDASYCHFFDIDNGDFYIPALTIVDGLELIKGFVNVFYDVTEWRIETKDEKNDELYNSIEVGATLKECVEKSLTYLLNENLLGTDKK